MEGGAGKDSVYSAGGREPNLTSLMRLETNRAMKSQPAHLTLVIHRALFPVSEAAKDRDTHRREKQREKRSQRQSKSRDMQESKAQVGGPRQGEDKGQQVSGGGAGGEKASP